jgi:hypothetical protein
MCFGPSSAEKQAAAEARAAAEEQKQAQIQEKANIKRDSISSAIEGRTSSVGKAGGTGRRSLFTSASGGAGYASRF